MARKKSSKKKNSLWGKVSNYVGDVTSKYAGKTALAGSLALGFGNRVLDLDGDLESIVGTEVGQTGAGLDAMASYNGNTFDWLGTAASTLASYVSGVPIESLVGIGVLGAVAGFEYFKGAITKSLPGYVKNGLEKIRNLPYVGKAITTAAAVYAAGLLTSIGYHAPEFLSQQYEFAKDGVLNMISGGGNLGEVKYCVDKAEGLSGPSRALNLYSCAQGQNLLPN